MVETEHQSLNLISFGSLWSVLHYKLALIGLIHTLQVSKVPLIGHAIDGSSNHTLWQGPNGMSLWFAAWIGTYSFCPLRRFIIFT